MNIPMFVCAYHDGNIYDLENNIHLIDDSRPTVVCHHMGQATCTTVTEETMSTVAPLNFSHKYIYLEYRGVFSGYRVKSGKCPECGRIYCSIDRG